MAAWNESGRVRIGRIDADGNALDGAGILVAPDLAASQTLSGIAFDGVNYLVLIDNSYSSGSDRGLYARLVHRDGTFATGVLTVTPQQVNVPTVGWTGGAYRVLWTSSRRKIIAVDVSTSGLVYAPIETLLTAASEYDSF